MKKEGDTIDNLQEKKMYGSGDLTSLIKRDNYFPEVSAVIANSVSGNMGAAPVELNLFSEISPVDQKRLNDSDTAYMIDRQGRRIVVTRKEKELIYALSAWISQFRETEKFKNFVNELSINKEIQSDIKFPINIQEFSKLLFGRTNPEQIGKTMELLERLGSISQIVVLPYEDKEVRVVSPLIRLGDKVEVSKNGRTYAAQVDITFGKLFFWNFYNRYSLFPMKLFEIWNKKGSGTENEIFDILLELLINNFWHCITAYKTVRGKLAEELKAKGNKLDKTDFEKEAKRRQKNALTYRTTVSAILSKIDATYFKNQRKQALLKSALEKAGEVLKGEYVGIITYFKYIHETGDIVMIYNKDYGKKNFFTEDGSNQAKKLTNDGANPTNDGAKL